MSAVSVYKNGRPKFCPECAGKLVHEILPGLPTTSYADDYYRCDGLAVNEDDIKGPLVACDYVWRKKDVRNNQ